MPLDKVASKSILLTIWPFSSSTDKIADDCSATAPATPAIVLVPVGISTLLWHVYDVQ